MAASATFALNAELCVRRARLAIVTPDLRHSRRLQAEAPLIDLSEFGQPALSFGYTINDHAQTVAALVEHVSLEAIDLFGHSMGGSVAIVAARLLGARV